MSLGRKLRQLRQSRRLSGAQLAEQIGVSRSLISQIERDVASPSIDVLRRLATAFDVPVGVFFEPFEPNKDVVARSQSATERLGEGEATGNVAVVRADQRIQLRLPRSNLVYEMCTPLSRRNLQATWVTLGPGEAGAQEDNSHAGEEVTMIVDGQFSVFVANEEFILDAGDCITFPSHLPHRYVNRGDVPAIAFSVMTPAAY